MNRSLVCPLALWMVLGGSGLALGQYTAPPNGSSAQGGEASNPSLNSTPTNPSPLPEGMLPAPIDPNTSPPATTLSLPPGAVASPWLDPSCPECCGPIGYNGPIGSELYLRSGAALSIGDGEINERVQVGYDLRGGGRTLLFNPAADRAWVLDIGVGYTYNNGKQDDVGFLVDGELLSIRGLHRTSFSFGLGREWFLLRPVTDCTGPNVRFGVDVHGHYGSSHMDLNVVGFADGYRREHDAFGGYAVGIQTGIEIPFNSWFWTLGTRLEWRYTYLDLLPNFGGGFHDLNILFSSGIRF